MQPFPPTGSRWQVSTGGGFSPRWRGDSRELYYVAADGRLMAVPIGAGNTPDQVVPNSATEKLADAMGLPIVSTTTIDNVNGVDGLVQFAAGDHGSILSPAASAAATTEMQTEMAVFIGGYPAPAILPGGHGILIVDPSVIAQE